MIDKDEKEDKDIELIEEALRESNERFKSSFENAAIGMDIVSLDGRIIKTNRSFCEMLGYDEGELTGKNIVDITYPDDIAQNLEYRRRLFPGEITKFTMVKRYIHKHGNPVWVELSVSLVHDSQGNPAYVIGQIQDITERKRVEEKLQKAYEELETLVWERTIELVKSNEALVSEIEEHKIAKSMITEQAELIDKAHDAVIVRDMSERLIYCNKAAEKLYGWNKEDVLGRNINTLFYRTRRMPSILEDAYFILMEKGEWAGELQQSSANGKEIIVSSSWTLVRDQDGKPKSVLIISSDITAKKRLESQFLRAKRMESLGTLAGGMAHDLNNMLTPIILSGQMLRERSTDEKDRKLLGMIDKNARRGADLIKQVLAFARGVEGDRRILNVETLIRDIERIVRETFNRAIEIRVKVPSDIWNIKGDITRLHQVMMNILLNAQDEMHEGGILSITAKDFFINEDKLGLNIDAKVGPYVLISISDTGKGIPHDIIDRIFEPFFTTKDVGRGTGLGLSTAAEIVKNHGGFVDVESVEGMGTTFKVYLPAIADGEVQAIVEKKAGDISSGNGETILIIDDEKAIRDITGAMLEAKGYRTLTAGDGSEGLTVFAKHGNIDLVLIDMMMPVMNGPSAICELVKLNPSIRIIAMSGLDDINKIVSTGMGNVKSYLSKPFSSDALLTAVINVLEADHNLIVGRIETS